MIIASRGTVIYSAFDSFQQDMTNIIQDFNLKTTKRLSEKVKAEPQKKSKELVLIDNFQKAAGGGRKGKKERE